MGLLTPLDALLLINHNQSTGHTAVNNGGGAGGNGSGTSSGAQSPVEEQPGSTPDGTQSHLADGESDGEGEGWATSSQRPASHGLPMWNTNGLDATRSMPSWNGWWTNCLELA